MIKRLVALVLVLLLSIESFAAVVSDNDGSAFITKGEFDSLKNSFQNQIDQYNTSIDSKIDGAIAAYLSGIRMDKTFDFRLPYDNDKFWIYANFRPNLPHSITNWFYNNRPTRTNTDRILGTATKTTFDNYSLGAPPIWIRSISDTEVYADEYGGFDDIVTINMTGNLDGTNYLGLSTVLDAGSGVVVAGYLASIPSDALDMNNYVYVKNTTSWGHIPLKLCQYGADTVETDLPPNFQFIGRTEIDGVLTARYDQNNSCELERNSINNYLDNITYSNTRYVPLTVSTSHNVFAIESHSSNPCMYQWNPSGMFQRLDKARMSGEHKVYTYEPYPRDLTAIPKIKPVIMTGTKFFFGFNNGYTTLKRRDAAGSSTIYDWLTPHNEQTFILPNSGKVSADNLYQKLFDDQNNKLKSYGGIKITDKAEGDISFNLSLQAWGYNAGGDGDFVPAVTSYKVAAGTKPFTDNTTNTDYVKINDSTTNVVSLSENGTYKISIKDVKGDPVYFKIVPDNDRDVEVKITDCQYTTSD